MTADVELLPLPEPRNDDGSFRDWQLVMFATANVVHATAANDAEIKRLREAYRGQVIERANEIKLREKADAEIEALRADAERYRWLRGIGAGRAAFFLSNSDDMIDAAIDQARGKGVADEA